MTATAQTGDHLAERPLRLEWDAPDGADERAIAAEAIAALTSFAGSWFEPLAIEVRLGCYDREIFAEGDSKPPSPYQMLVREPTPASIEVDPIYRAVETRVPSLSGDAVWSWVERALSQSCGDAARFETSLCNVYVQASRVPLPPGWATDDTLPLECYAGTIKIPVESHDDGAWVSAPPAGHGLHQPIDIALDNASGNLRFMIHVYWSPWMGELGRPESPLAQAVARLVARGWQPATD